MERVRENLDDYDKEVIKQIEIDDRYEFEMPTDEEIDEGTKLASIDREKTLIELTLALSKQVQELREEVRFLESSKSGVGFWRR